jgi:preprotein translocase subunit YajC
MLFNFLEPTENNPTTLILFIVLIVGMVGLLVWQSISGKKKQKEAQNMVNALKKGDRVKTIGGVCGFVYEINDAENTFVLETGAEGNKSYVKFDKGAIYQTAPAQGNAVPAPKAEEKKEEIKEEKQVEEVVAEEKITAKKSTKAKKEKSAEEKAE